MRRRNQEGPLMRIYIIGNDGITLCREPPANIEKDEIAVGSKEELQATRLSGKRLLALWNALPGVEKRIAGVLEGGPNHFGMARAVGTSLGSGAADHMHAHQGQLHGLRANRFPPLGIGGVVGRDRRGHRDVIAWVGETRRFDPGRLDFDREGVGIGERDAVGRGKKLRSLAAPREWWGMGHRADHLADWGSLSGNR